MPLRPSRSDYVLDSGKLTDSFSKVETHISLGNYLYCLLRGSLLLGLDLGVLRVFFFFFFCCSFRPKSLCCPFLTSSIASPPNYNWGAIFWGLRPPLTFVRFRRFLFLLFIPDTRSLPFLKCFRLVGQRSGAFRAESFFNFNLTPCRTLTKSALVPSPPAESGWRFS